MERYVVGLGLFAVAGAIVFASIGSARAQSGPASFTKCAVIETVYDPEDLDKRWTAIPPGWTPIGGGATASALPYGAVVVCR